MKILYVTSQSGRRVNSFMRSAILAAKRNGDRFTMACNMAHADPVLYREDCAAYGIDAVHIDFDRNPLAMRNLRAARQLLAVMQQGQYDAVHCNTPIGGLLRRLCARRAKIPHVIYQAHGFHFYTGAPLKNWLLYYPVERALAHITDTLITINREDYARAKGFGAKRVCYVPGVGIDTRKFSLAMGDRAQTRRALGLGPDDFALLSVGELIERKNHAVVLRALARLKNTRQYEKLHYFICGSGRMEQALQNLAASLDIAAHVHFLGYRTDVAQLCGACDQFVFMSIQEGLPSALMEAMACGIPVICSPIRGNTDLIKHNVTGYIANNTDDGVAQAVLDAMQDRDGALRCAKAARQRVKEFDLACAAMHMQRIYQSISGGDKRGERR